MRILLRDDVDGVGKKGDLVEVADGFGRNYLVPRGLAIQATPGIQQQADAMRRSRDVRDTKDRQGAEEIATRLVGKPITVTHRAGDGGKLYGSVTAADLVAAVEAQTGVPIDRRKVQLDEPIRELGTHTVMVKLHSEVQFPITLEVVEG